VKQSISAFLCGGMFAAGLAISGMVKPSKVVGFLDVTGAWDPTLAFVMGGALLVFMPTYHLIVRRARPVLAASFDIPKRKDVNVQLVAGASMFGVGWGIAGLCPAAGIAALPALSPNAIAVTLGMAIGIVATRAVRKAGAPAEPAPVADF
jgi:hypothetical protein